MKNLREKIEEILKEFGINVYHEKQPVDQILSLFNSEKKKIPCCGHSCCCNLPEDIRKEQRNRLKEIMK